MIFLNYFPNLATFAVTNYFSILAIFDFKKIIIIFNVKEILIEIIPKLVCTYTINKNWENISKDKSEIEWKSLFNLIFLSREIKLFE